MSFIEDDWYNCAIIKIVRVIQVIRVMRSYKVGTVDRVLIIQCGAAEA